MKEDYVNRVVKVKRVQDRIMRLKLEIKGVIVECVYAPKEEKEEFWSKLDLVVECSHGGETDKRFTGHVGARNREHEVLGRYGVRKEMWKGSG